MLLCVPQSSIELLLKALSVDTCNPGNVYLNLVSVQSSLVPWVRCGFSSFFVT